MQTCCICLEQPNRTKLIVKFSATFLCFKFIMTRSFLRSSHKVPVLSDRQGGCCIISHYQTMSLALGFVGLGTWRWQTACLQGGVWCSCATEHAHRGTLKCTDIRSLCLKWIIQAKWVMFPTGDIVRLCVIEKGSHSTSCAEPVELWHWVMRSEPRHQISLLHTVYFVLR